MVSHSPWHDAALGFSLGPRYLPGAHPKLSLLGIRVAGAEGQGWGVVGHPVPRALFPCGPAFCGLLPSQRSEDRRSMIGPRCDR